MKYSFSVVVKDELFSHVAEYCKKFPHFSNGIESLLEIALVYLNERDMDKESTIKFHNSLETSNQIVNIRLKEKTRDLLRKKKGKFTWDQFLINKLPELGESLEKENLK